MKNLILLYSFMIVLISSLSLFAQNKLDQFQYHYPTSSNQLYYVNDVVPGHVSTIDIDNQSTNNYSYNANGQLTKDEQQNIDTIIWHANGKVKEVHKTTGDVLSFKYDALGNRIVKQLTTNNGQLTTTFYTRNTSSQVIAIYEKQNIDSIKLTELTISGIGNQNETTNHLQNKTNDSVAYRKIGNKNYELKDHLGNIRATITDIKQPSNLFNFFNSTISSTSDYYNYGMQMPGRNYKTENYRYGIQGKEKDNELAGNGNAYDFGARILDPRVGRWLSTDPMETKFPSFSSYNVFENNPINKIDPDGKSALAVFDPSTRTITIEATVNIYGSGATIETAQTIQEQIDMEYNDRIFVTTDPNTGQEYTVRFNITVTIVAAAPATLPDDLKQNYIEVVDDTYVTDPVSGNTSERSFVNNDARTGIWRGKSRMGQELKDDCPAAHELIHLLSLDDHYDENTHDAIPGWEGAISAESANSGHITDAEIALILRGVFQKDGLRMYESLRIYQNLQIDLLTHPDTYYADKLLIDTAKNLTIMSGISPKKDPANGYPVFRKEKP